MLPAGCSLFLTPPEVNISAVNLVGLNAGGLELEFLLAVTNPNPYAITLQGYSYDVEVQAVPLAKGGDRDHRSFPAKETTTVRLPVRLDYGALLALLKRRIDPDRVPYRLRAGFDLATPLGNYSLPIERSSTFVIPQQYRPSHYLERLKELFPRQGN